jgi:hypothetical protein
MLRKVQRTQAGRAHGAAREGASVAGGRLNSRAEARRQFANLYGRAVSYILPYCPPRGILRSVCEYAGGGREWPARAAAAAHRLAVGVGGYAPLRGGAPRLRAPRLRVVVSGAASSAQRASSTQSAATVARARRAAEPTRTPRRLRRVRAGYAYQPPALCTGCAGRLARTVRTGLGRFVRTAYRGTPGDQPAGFASLGRKMALPETTALALRAPLPLPAGLPGSGSG